MGGSSSVPLDEAPNKLPNEEKNIPAPMSAPPPGCPMHSGNQVKVEYTRTIPSECPMHAANEDSKKDDIDPTNMVCMIYFLVIQSSKRVGFFIIICR